MIYALSLLQHLCIGQLPFVFKGGTSLLLLLENANRFSVDVDIITQASRQEVEQALDRIAKTSLFTTWKLDERRSYQPGIPKAHYKLEYVSQIDQKANYILLDILFEKSQYPVVHALPIQCPWIETELILLVTLPTIESITGDKLTAFAPNTTGILYERGKELEIIKQLFDLGQLFDRIKVMDIVAKSFSAFVTQELVYRGLKLSAADILWDIIHTCRIISFRERNRHEPDKSHFTELLRGIRSFDSYLISGHFIIDDAVTAASKVAYLCSKLLREEYSPLERYHGQAIQSLEITDPSWNALNKLKRFPDRSAFFYWYQCLSILRLSNAA